MKNTGDDQQRTIRIAVVGPCASGKSTLVKVLREMGYPARMPAQEHSYVADMWQRMTTPDVLVYLDVQYESIAARRKISWGPEWLDVQRQRLAHAHAHADLHLDTSEMTPQQVLERVLALLESI